MRTPAHLRGERRKRKKYRIMLGGLLTAEGTESTYTTKVNKEFFSLPKCLDYIKGVKSADWAKIYEITLGLNPDILVESYIRKWDRD